MKDEFGSVNANAYEYGQAVASQISDLCAPFLDTLGLTTFLYGRIFYDGRYLMLSNKAEWVKSWLWDIPTIEDTILHKVLQSVPLEKHFYFLWETAPDNMLIQMHNQMGIWHGFDISYRLEDSIEGWSFSTSQDRYQINNFYLNNLKLFHHFILYLREKAGSLLEIKDQKQLAHFKKGVDLSFSPSFLPKKEINSLLSSLPIEGYTFHMNNKQVRLSRREIECMLHLSQGKTIKEIARSLLLSPRTVESYIGTVKLKTGEFNKSILINMLKENLFKWL